MQMQHYLNALLAIFAASTFALAPQTQADSTEVERQMEALRADIVVQSHRLNELRSPETVIRTGLLEEFYQKGDARLLVHCFEAGSNAYGLLWMRIMAEENPALQNRNALMALRGGPIWWCEPEDLSADGFGTDGGGTINYWTRIVRHTLPANVLAKYPLSERKNRPIIASLLEKALASASKSERPPTEPERPGNGSLPTRPAQNPSVASSPQTPASPVTEAVLPANERKVKTWPWVAGILALLAIAAVAVKRRP